MSASADKAVTHMIHLLMRDPRRAYYFDPCTESMVLLTAAYAESHGLNVDEFRKEYYAGLRFEAPRAA